LKVDTEYLRRHYAEISDEALLEIDRNDLVDAAQRCYDEEVARRRAARRPRTADASDGPDVEVEDEAGLEDESGPDWLERAACVCTYVEAPGGDAACDADEARNVLLAAGIPCHIAFEKLPQEASRPRRDHEYRVLVPGGRNLEAISVLDVQLFNPRVEAEWKAHLEELPDEEFSALSPETLCAGLLDRAERLRRTYEDEVARRREGGS
jgi:hypothetical protein